MCVCFCASVVCRSVRSLRSTPTGTGCAYVPVWMKRAGGRGGKDTTGQRKAGEEGEMWLLVSLAQARWLVMQIDVHVSGVQDVLYE